MNFNHRILSCITLGAFSVTSISPAYGICYPQYTSAIVNDAFFIHKIEKMVEKFNKHKDKGDIEKVMDDMFALKHEVESYLGKAVSLDKVFDSVKNQLKNEGINIKDEYFKNYKKIYKHKEKKHMHQLGYIAECLENGIEYDAALCELDFQCKHKDSDKEPIILPFQLQLGITCCLAGGFLSLIQIPFVSNIGYGVFNFGIALIVNEYYINPTIQDMEKQK